MKVELYTYRHRKKDIFKLLDKYSKVEEIGTLATLTGLPIIVLLIFFEEKFDCGEDEKFLNKVNNIVDFYQYDTVQLEENNTITVQEYIWGLQKKEKDN